MKQKENENLVKVFFDLSGTGWEWESESLWALAEESTDIFKLDNIPLLAYGISQGDIFRAELSKDGVYYFKEVIKHEGNSTFRINFKEIPDKKVLEEYLNDFKTIGCNYEGNGATIYAIDVPSEVDQKKVVELLMKGEASALWDYEEGYVYKV
ncbi:MAG: hypothetical protein RLZZ234_708 [Candidatus Parcubacteria bacterium]|jgi:hypothetical protein